MPLDSTVEVHLTVSEARRLGTDSFAFGFPLLTMAATMRQTTNGAAPSGRRIPLNRFAHLHRFPDPTFRAIVGTDAYTLYSPAWLDLSAEPLLVGLPDTGGRSYLLPLVDAWTHAFACLGPRTVGTSGGTYAIVGPGWSGTLPRGARRLDAPTNTVWAICHIHAAGRKDLDRGVAIQQRLTLTPLSALGNSHASSNGGVAPKLDSAGLDPDRMPMEMTAGEFFEVLAREMGANPAADDDRLILERLAAIGLRPGQPFAWASLPTEIREALEAGLGEGREAVAMPPELQLENGWQSPHEEPGTEGSDYLRRAQLANVALGIAPAEDAIFPLTAVDGEGRRLNGAQRYALHFEPGELPPVEALWSLALYDMDQLPVDNAIDRYALGSRDELELGADGSLEIAIQRDRPDGSDANWLPAPDGDFNLMLHMYWPSRGALDGSWTIPPVRRSTDGRQNAPRPTGG